MKSLTIFCKITPNKKHKNMSKSKSKKWTVKTECTSSKFDTKSEADDFAVGLMTGEDAMTSDQVEIIAPK